MPPDADSKLKQALANILGIPLEAIDDQTSTDTVAAWDSLNHLTLVLAIEEQFDVSLTEEQTTEMVSYPLLKIVLAEHGVAFAAS